MFRGIDSNQLQAILANTNVMHVDSMQDGYAEVGAVRHENEKRYGYSIFRVKDTNGVWKIANL